MASDLHIGYVVETFPSPSETFIANEIAGVVACGATVTVFALRRGESGLAPPVDVVYPTGERVGVGDLFRLAGLDPVQALRRGGVVRRFADEAARRGVTHLHAHFAGLPTTLALMMARLHALPLSFSAHARDVYVRPIEPVGKLRLARLCIACTDAAANTLRMAARSGDCHKVRRIYHGTDLERFPYRPKDAVSRPPLVLAVGRMVPKKGFAILLRAFAELKGRVPCALRVVGDGPQLPGLKGLALELGIEVDFAGWASHDALPDEYAAADVLAVPSVEAPDGDRDGLPNVVVEAMASGLPVVGSDFAGIPEAVRDGETGLLVPPGDPAALAALERVLNDVELRRAVIGQARREVEERFDCRRNAAEVHAAISEIG